MKARTGLNLMFIGAVSTLTGVMIGSIPFLFISLGIMVTGSFLIIYGEYGD